MSPQHRANYQECHFQGWTVDNVESGFHNCVPSHHRARASRVSLCSSALKSANAKHGWNAALSYHARAQERAQMNYAKRGCEDLTWVQKA